MQHLTHNEISAICRGIIVKALNLTEEHEIPTKPWDDYVFNFSATYSDKKSNEAPFSKTEIREDFKAIVVSVQKEAINFPAYYSEAMQRHYEYYTNPEHATSLDQQDQLSIELALSRLAEGLVKPATWHQPWQE